MRQNLPNVKLRAIEPEDLDILYRIENDMSLWNDSVTSVPYSRYILYDYIANTKNDIYTDRQVRMMIENEKQEVVGIIDLINFEPKHLRAEIGIVVFLSVKQPVFQFVLADETATFEKFCRLLVVLVYVCIQLVEM